MKKMIAREMLSCLPFPLFHLIILAYFKDLFCCECFLPLKHLPFADDSAIPTLFSSSPSPPYRHLHLMYFQTRPVTATSSFTRSSVPL
jgi:hypothetical protein